jgi:tetratricopeptide (TPR) repeat protein
MNGSIRVAGALFATPLFLASAEAQMAVSTFGATDAAQCYENAANDFSSDTDPCDVALRGNMSRSDEKKTLVNRGIIHNRNGSLQEAADDFNAALDIDGGLAEAYLNRGNTYFLAGQNDAAIEDYEHALSLGVSKPWAAWYNLGLAYEAKSDKAKAREAYQKALDENPSFAMAKEKLTALGPS